MYLGCTCSFAAGVCCASSVRITGNRCEIRFENDIGTEQCVLTEGNHIFDDVDGCKNDAYTQYTVLEGPRGRLLM